MKINIRPKSPKIVLVYSLCLIIICSCIVAIPIMFIDLGISWLTICATIMAILVMGYFSLLFWSHILRKIEIKKKSIYVSKDRGGKLIRTVQYSTSVNFEDVVDLRLMTSTKDSHNQERFGLFTPMTYLVVACKDGHQQLFNLYYYSKKQIAELIDLIINKIIAVGNEIGGKTKEEILEIQ